VDTADLYLKWNDGTPLVHVVVNGQVLYIDDDHLSVAGAQLAANTIRAALVTAIERGPALPAERAAPHAP
jgi:hypothetical protein